MPKIRDTKVWITIDRKVLPEYQVEEDGENVIKCFIPSKTGKNFEISVDDRSSYKCESAATKARVEIDGTLMSDAWASGDKEVMLLDGIFDHKKRLRKFRFANLAVTDDDTYRHAPSPVGLIKVLINWMGPCIGDTIYQAPKFTPLTSDPVHERTKKMATHRVALGEAERNYYAGLWTTRRDLLEYPPIEFHFQYANEDLLMARDIMPTPVSERSTAQKRPIDILDSDDDLTKEEEEQLRRLQEKQRRRDIKRVKAEIKSEPETIKLESNEVIDLTD